MTSVSFSQFGVSQSETPPKSMVTAPSMARREFTVKTHRGLFNARVGAKVKIKMKHEELKGKIHEFHFRYRKDEAFQSTFKIREELEMRGEE
jgi:hypothetical protein